MGTTRLRNTFVGALLVWAGLAAALDTETIVQQNEGAAVVIWGTDPASGRELQGSGCCVDTRGYVLTVAHQVAGLGQFRARLRDGSERQLTLLDMHEAREIALLKSDAPMPQAVRIGDAGTLRSGSALVSIAAPVGLEFSAATGIVSNPNRTRLGEPMIQADIQASPGSSGGPVFERNGVLIGLIVNRLEREEWIKMVTPINNAYDMLRAHGIAIPGDRPGADDRQTEIIPASNVTRDELQAIRAYNNGVIAGPIAEKVAAYTHAVQLLPEFFQAWFNLAVTHAAARDVALAIEAYQEAAAAVAPDAPQAVAVQRNLGRTYLAGRRLEDAAACFERARQLAPDDASSHNDLGEVNRQLKRFGEAEEAFLAALKLRPDYASAHYNLGLTYAEAGQAMAAVEQFEHYLRLMPNAADGTQVRKWLEQLKAGAR